MINFGRFPFSQNFRNFRFGGKWHTFRRFVPLEYSQKQWKIQKGGPVFPVGIGMSCSIYVSRSLYQFQVHGRTPRRAGVYDQMEQLFTNRKFHFCSHRNFRLFFLNGKRPINFISVSGLLVGHVRPTNRVARWIWWNFGIIPSLCR